MKVVHKYMKGVFQMSEYKIYTLDEVAKKLGVTKRTLYSYIKAEKLKANKPQGRWIVTEDNLRLFVEGEKDSEV